MVVTEVHPAAPQQRPQRQQQTPLRKRSCPRSETTHSRPHTFTPIIVMRHHVWVPVPGL